MLMHNGCPLNVNALVQQIETGDTLLLYKYIFFYKWISTGLGGNSSHNMDYFHNSHLAVESLGKDCSASPPKPIRCPLLLRTGTTINGEISVALLHCDNQLFLLSVSSVFQEPPFLKFAKHKRTKPDFSSSRLQNILSHVLLFVDLSTGPKVIFHYTREEGQAQVQPCQSSLC